jgi:hypothetical protein
MHSTYKHRRRRKRGVCVGRVYAIAVCECYAWRWHNADLRPFMSPGGRTGGWRFVERVLLRFARGNWSSTKVKRVVNFEDFLFISGIFKHAKLSLRVCTKSQLFARIAASMAAVRSAFIAVCRLNCLKYDKFG